MKGGASVEDNKTYAFAPSELLSGEGTFEMKFGGTTYVVSTHFDAEGRQSVLEQFMALLLQKA